MAEYDNVIENQVLGSTLRLVGSQWDNTIVRNVVIENVNGDGVMLRDVENVTFENVTIRNVSGDGIKLSTMGSTSNVAILNSTISEIGEDGINAGQRFSSGVDHPGLQIIGNTIDNTGMNGSGGGLIHGIYVQSTDFHIEGNRVTNSQDGNGISVRSWGIIRDNEVDNAHDSGIAYFADHMGRNGTLIIERNTVTDSGYENGRTDVDLLSVPNASNLVAAIVVRDNNLERGTDVGRGYDNVSLDFTSGGGAPQASTGGSTPAVVEDTSTTVVDNAPTPSVDVPEAEIVGTGGNNVLRGTEANEGMLGRSGADTFVFERNGGTDTIKDFDFGVDKIAIYGFNGLDTASDLIPFASEKNGNTVIATATGDKLIIENTKISDFSNKDFDFNFEPASDVEEPTSNDGGSATQVSGDAGNNVIRGTAADNSMFGLSGSDTFVFERNGGTDTIEDFAPGTDRIVVYGFNDLTSVSDLADAARESGGDTIITSDTGDVLVIANTDISDFSAHHFLFI